MARLAPTVWDIRPAANARWAEAEALLWAGHEWGAHCLIGLSVEQALKAWCLLTWFPKGRLSPLKDAREAFVDMFLEIQGHSDYLALTHAGWFIGPDGRRWKVRAPLDGSYTFHEAFHSILFWCKVAELVSVVRFKKAPPLASQLSVIVNSYHNEDRYLNNPSAWNPYCYNRGLDLHVLLDLDGLH